MSEHTPGPWVVQTPMTGDDLVVEARPGMDYHELVRVRAPQYGNGANFDEMRANARLIAAAPELLEALKALTDRIIADNSPLCMTPEHDRAVVALSKAQP